MSERASEEKPLPTIRRVPDELWEKIEPTLAERDPPKSTGRRRIDQRGALDAIIFRLRTAVASGTAIPRGVPRRLLGASHLPAGWIEPGVLELIWAAAVEECEGLGGVDREWQAADGAMGKARFGGTS